MPFMENAEKGFTRIRMKINFKQGQKNNLNNLIELL